MAIRRCHRLALLAATCLAAGGVLNPLKAYAAQSQVQTPTAAESSASSRGPQPKHTGPACVSIADAAAKPGLAPTNPLPINKDGCLSAHVYDVVELADGTRFLDVCPVDVPDADCRFVLMSLRTDRDDVGDLRRYRGQDVSVRGTMRPMRGRMGIVISHARQFSGGPEKFKPNPKLLRDFNGQSDRMPVRDPNLASTGHHRSFMNTQDRETLPANSKP
jgi:hypothetical protein